MTTDPFILDLLHHPEKAEAVIASSDPKSLAIILISLRLAEQNSVHANAASLVELFSARVAEQPKKPPRECE
ncbi:hypothetical protein [Mesoterricola silvestris]|uniref:Uncharacterized protein n=1 Tax=Mesoterricola silvestris TaxID=2927979 RepID=A0AA48KAI9_9BACT|nr:hypothetical protein [Mesoterricola silvestris]BDU71543.1 hypothetical protein METEAL_07170 [Mesoterricola silvestris]